MRFLFCRETYVIEYEDEDGKVRTKNQGLAPRRKDHLGLPLTEEQFAAEMRLCRKKAMAMWNNLDKSKRPRLNEDQEP